MTTPTTHPVKSYSLTLLQDHELLHSLNVVLSRDHETTAELLAHLAEVITRRLWAAEGYPSMLEFCVRGLNMSEGVALKRIQAAKTANEFPDVFGMVAAGRLHLSAVCMLAPRLTRENAPGLLAASVHRSKAGIAKLLAERFPRPDVPTSIRPMQASSYDPDHTICDASLFKVPAQVPAAKVAPLSAETYELRCTLGQQLHEKLRYVQALLGRTVASGDIPTVLELALDALTAAKEKQKFAVTSRPRQQRHDHKAAPQGRHIPAHVRRAVLEREAGCCTFKSNKGTVCGSQRGLHFDHIVPFACGGESTAENLRLRCAAHNRLEAERQFGRGFMDRKVQDAMSAAPVTNVNAQSETQVPEPEISTVPEQVDRIEAETKAYPHDPDHTAVLAQREEIFLCLRALKFKLEEARYGASLCDHLVGQPLEICVKHALQQLTRARFERCTVRPTSRSAQPPVTAAA